MERVYNGVPATANARRPDRTQPYFTVLFND